MSLESMKNTRTGPSSSAQDALDVGKVRGDFPVLGRTVNGRQLAYLDSAATSQKPESVISAMSAFYERSNANPHRGVHTLAGEATAAYEGARERVAGFLNAPVEGVVFTRGCTEAINLVAHSWARARLGPGDEVLCTEMEHHSNMVPWQMAAREKGFTLRYLPVTGSGDLESGALERMLNRRTGLVAVSGASNVLGTFPDLEPIVEAAHGVGAKVLVDAAQLAPHAPVDFGALDADFLAVAGHKMIGPTGIGVLAARPALLDEMQPFIGGGGMILDVTLEGSRWMESPWKFEAGTPLVAEAVGLAAAVDYLEALGMDAVRDHERMLTEHALARFAEIEDFHLYGTLGPERRGATFSFNIGDRRGGIIHPHDAGTFLDSRGIAIRAGHHCAKPLMRRFEVVAMCRASCHLYNTTEEIDRLVDAVHEARNFFNGD